MKYRSNLLKPKYGQIQKISNGGAENFQNSIKDLTRKIKHCEDNIDDKVSSIKKHIKEIETK